MLIELRDLHFKWPGNPRDTLCIPQFSLSAEEKLFLHGPSGSGKSTLLALLAGIQSPDSGQLTVLGQDLAKLSAPQRDHFRANHLGYVFQQFNLLPYLSVRQNVLLGCQFSRLRRQRATGLAGSPEKQALALLAQLELGDLADRPARALSVGQQQRVAVARALIGAPELLIADEPTSALDEARRDAFVSLLFACAEQQRTAVVLVSHDPRLAEGFDRSLNLSELNTASQVDHV
ncbi:ABC transporter ATP-binding protein [Jeongeupia chitinilytica]|uniref:ABC transporter ATP-binding protein n=1 Tax=Jeongeupia chitinilytica TaxID=1041641 RepID=A0ABQ3H488_9NEIS|nr:ABC transporter ATP-binding protein [Jeongeupia chitinilytica]GHD69760.1 ABC transporter ATP-binding protein [Jeongeupia chitinilytica]